MFKKIILGVLFAGVTVLLIVGGVYRTAARLEDEDRQAGASRSQNLNVIRQYKNEPEFSNQQGRNESDRNNGGRGSESGQGRNESAAQFEPADEVVILGTVIEVTPDFMKVAADDGSEILVENRVWWYAKDAGFSAELNDAVELRGFLDEVGKFEVSWMANLASGSSVSVREQGGRPNWAGSGNRKNQG